MNTHFVTYLKERKLSDADFAAQAGMGRPYVCKLRTGAAIPSLKTAARIESLTGGRVSASSWIPEASEERAA